MRSVIVTAIAIPDRPDGDRRGSLESCRIVWKFWSPHTRSICDDSSLSRQKAVTSISASDAR